jgi:hypothetical protein
MILSLWFVMLGVFLWAQVPSSDKADQSAIQRAKNVLVSSLDSRLPKVSLEFFLNYEAGGAQIQWELHDCGERTGNPSTDGSNSALCVEADFEKDETAVAVLVSIETFKGEPSGVPAVFRATVNGLNGKSHSLRRLGDLPKELHRPTHGMPRDLPVPTIASSESPSAAPGACLRPA